MIAPWMVPWGPRSAGAGLHQLRAGGAQRQRPGGGVAVGVARVSQDVAERDAVSGHAGQHRGQGADRAGGRTTG